MLVTADKNNLVHELFVRTADDNYITARWCAANQLNTDFLWLSLHALEKYLKAVLLMNGRSTLDRAHDIVRLYEDVKRLAGPLLPEHLDRPAKLGIAVWFELSAVQFVEHLSRNGNADNRYLMYGYATHSQDLHLLDEMVFRVRRLICSLDERVWPDRLKGATTFTNREQLANDPRFYGRLFMPLDNLIAAKDDSPARVAALNLNFAFAPDNFQHTPIRGGSASINPVILRRIFEPLKTGDARQTADSIDLADWLLANVHIPKTVRIEIERAIAAARTKHGLP